MELNKELSSLIDRAWSLHGKLNHEIQNTTPNFRSFCSENCYQHCGIAFVDCDRLIAIRDSVKEVENILLSLQKLQCWQVKERHEALARVEESRLVVIELVKNYQGRKTPHVLRELNSCFGDENAVLVQNLNAELRKHDGDNKWSVSSLVRRLFINWKWKVGVAIALKFLIFSVKIGHTRNVGNSSQMRESVLIISRNPLNVFEAKG